MNIRFSGATTRRSIAALALTAAGLLSGNVPALAAWEHAHGDSANTGFARLNTAPAARPSRSAPVGRVAPGANPVVAPNGTVYVGNLSGELKAFHANGAPYWTRELNSLHGGIFAAPVVGADGSVYVVSSIHYRDHRDGVLNVRNDFFLHKFTPGGGWVFAMPFPEHFSFDPAKANRGATTAPPNIWRANGTEAIIAPVVVEAYGGEQLRLVAFSTNGDVLDDELVRHTPYEITGGSEWGECVEAGYYNPFTLIGCTLGLGVSFGSPGVYVPLAGAGFPMAGVAIRQSGGRDMPPMVMVADGLHDKVGYSFSPQSGFSEVFRSTDPEPTLSTPPVVLPDGNTAVGTFGGTLMLTGPALSQPRAVGNFGEFMTAALTRLDDGRLAVIGRNGSLRLLSGNSITYAEKLAGESVASAAASCTHLFVASEHELVTYDVKNMMPVARVSWSGVGRSSGLHAPVIGPNGHVYAIASETLYVFPGPQLGGTVGKTACDKLVPISGGTLGK